jgi:hypothetical protein
MLSPEAVSIQVEEERKKNRYYLTSKVMMMGSLLTEGEHLYLDKRSEQWQAAMDLFIKDVQEKQEACGANGIYLRDIDSDDEALRVYLINKGFVKSDMPDSWIIEDLTWENEEEMVNRLTYRSRKHVRQNVYRHIDSFIIEANNNKPENIYKWYNMYKKVKEKNLKLNTFSLPEKIFEESVTNPNWDIMEFFIQEKAGEKKELAAVVFSYKNNRNYCPVFLGINYDFSQRHSVYRQIIYQLVLRAKQLGFRKIYLGVEASEEKRKFGATQKRHSVFMQVNENFSLSTLGQYSNNIIP